MVQDRLPFSERSDIGPAAETAIEPGDAAPATPVTVGIGASAGGQEALESIFTALPSRCDLAFVVVMHLPADAPSLLTDLIRRCTSMRVVTADEEMVLQPDTVYIPPPGRELLVKGGKLLFREPDGEDTPHHPIDRFLTSLAADLGRHAIAVILSGFGVDGSEGVKRVREGGGLVYIQDPNTATSPYMPMNAVSTGAADMVLPPEGLADRLSQIGRVDFSYTPQSRLVATDEELNSLFTVLKARTSHDFSSYKRNTVLRRIERRITVNAAGGFSKYLDVLKDTPQEAHALCQELLIGVTSFFRDPEAFEQLRRRIIPTLFAGRKAEEPVRIWHASCATGEEAYSVAMLIMEHLEKEDLQAKVQIFATDLDEAAVARARTGLYADDIIQGVSEDRLQRFFTRGEGCWQVTRQLREMIVFAPHNIIKDPPFSRLDLLVCRNFLIYLNPEIQKLLIPLFHQVLNNGGFLFLGAAETVGVHGDLFSPVDKKWKIFIRQEGKSRVDTLMPFSGPVCTIVDIGRSIKTSEAQETATVAFAEKLLMERYVPAYVIINEKSEVVHFSNQAGAYLRTPEGKPTRDLLKKAREELRPALRAAIYKAFADQKETEYRGIQVAVDGRSTTVNIAVTPLVERAPSGRLALVILEPGSDSAEQAAQNGEDPCTGDDTSRNSLTRHLEEQLQVAGEQLQYMSEQLETSYEKYMLANEELMTVNEELQSTNEELQSTNEELVTVNSELQKKMEELNESNSDLEHLFTSSEIAILFLDRELSIKRFSPAMAAIFDLIPADTGRPVRHLKSSLDVSSLPLEAVSVLENLVPIEREVASRDGRGFIMRVLPYKTTEGAIDGIVVTLVDISERKRAEEALYASERALREGDERLRFALESCHIGAWDLNLVDHTTYRSLEHSRIFGYRELLPDWTLEMFLDHIVPEDRQEVTEIIRRGVAAQSGWSFECRIRRVDGAIRWIWAAGRPSMDTAGSIRRVTGVVQDITERKLNEEALLRSELQYRTLFDTLIEGFCTIEMIFNTDDRAVDYRFMEMNPAFETQTGWKNVKGRLISDLAPGLEQHWFERFGKVALTGEPVQFESEAKPLGRHYYVCAYRIGDPAARTVAILFNDITERKRAVEILRQSELRRSLALEAAQAGTWEWDLESNENIWSNELWSLYGLKPYSCNPSYEEWRKVVHPEDRGKTEHILREAVAARSAFTAEWRVVLGDGGERWLMSRGRPIKDSNDRVVRYLGTVMDITDRKRAEGENKILHAQLIQAQKMEAIGTLAGGIAHDFNNILGAVIGYAELAKVASPPGTGIADDLDKVLEAGKRATDLVKQILAFSRQVNSAERVPLDPVQPVKQAIRLLRPALPSTITIRQRLEGDISHIFADPTQVHQIVMNLCTNAFHAMEQTGGILEIGLRNCRFASQELPAQPGVEAGDFVELRITDSGPGIEPSIQNKIFEPYFTTKEVGKGTGMGLSIVHGIVITMGGFVSCESEVGTGTIFKVYFPAIAPRVAPVIKAVETVEKGKERILFVDDEPILAKMGKTMLERLGYTVTVHTSSEKALVTFQDRPEQFDAVITDQTMPGITGLDLARRMLRVRPDLPIILCTGYSNLVDEEQAYEAGIKGFIMKPMSMKDISQLLRKVLEN